MTPSDIKHKKDDDAVTSADRIFPHEPKERESLLNKTGVSGFLNLLWVFVVMWSLLHMLGTWKKIGYAVDLGLFYELTSDWRTLLVLWIGVSAYSLCVSVILEYVVNRFSVLHYPIIAVYCLSQFVLISLPAYYAHVHADGTALLRTALTLQCFVLMMKQHSYFMWHHYQRKKHVNTKGFLELSHNYFEHLWMPTLIYELDFPRKPTINVFVALWFFGETAFLMLVIYQILSSFIYPVLVDLPNYNLFEASMILGPSTLFLWLIGFYSVFHSLLNGLAEVTRLADREFYLEWWDATCMSQFWRLWNRVVYKWMCRHVYLESLRTVPWSFYDKTYAAIATQIVTAVFHEYVCATAFKMFRPTFFLVIVLQIPWGMATEKVKDTRFGNIIMWLGLMAGFPLLELTYAFFYLHNTK